jgi:hypothetical protein
MTTRTPTLKLAGLDWPASFLSKTGCLPEICLGRRLETGIARRFNLPEICLGRRLEAGIDRRFNLPAICLG